MIVIAQIEMARKLIDKSLEYLREAKHEHKKVYSDSRIVEYHVKIAILELQQAIDTLAEEQYTGGSNALRKDS